MSLLGFTLEHMLPDECVDLIDGLRTTQRTEHQWLLAHSFDGVTWGKWDGSQWALAIAQSGKWSSPDIRRTHLLDMRIFGIQSETFIWRIGDMFSGRILRDNADEIAPWAIPLTESWTILGDRLLDVTDNGFAVVGDARGSYQCIPFECVAGDFVTGKRRGVAPFRLTVRHYLERDDEDGSVRIAASRLVDFFKESRS